MVFLIKAGTVSRIVSANDRKSLSEVDLQNNVEKFLVCRFSKFKMYIHLKIIKGTYLWLHTLDILYILK